MPAPYSGSEKQLRNFRETNNLDASNFTVNSLLIANTGTLLKVKIIARNTRFLKQDYGGMEVK